MTVPAIQQAEAALFRRFTVRLRTTAPLCGGVPRNDELVRSWLKAHTGYDDATTDAQEAETREAMEGRITKGEDAVWTSFPSNAQGLYLHERQLKAMLKENAKVLGLVKANPGLGQILQHAVHVRPAYIALGRTEPDGCEEKPIHVMTAQGPRTALKRFDYLNPGVEFAFTVAVAKGGKGGLFTLEMLATILANAQSAGIGANRSQGFGTFEVAEMNEAA